MSVDGSPLEVNKGRSGAVAGLDDEHYMDEDIAKNGQTISNTKILPSVTEDENPFATRAVGD